MCKFEANKKLKKNIISYIWIKKYIKYFDKIIIN